MLCRCHEAAEGQGVQSPEGTSQSLGFLVCKMKGLEEVISKDLPALNICDLTKSKDK